MRSLDCSFVFFKQKTAYEMRISDWSSDVCSSDLHYAEVLIPFFVSRQIYAGAGKVLQTARGAMYCIAQRAAHLWEGVSPAPTRSRPIIHTRAEPHTDDETYRRLHVPVPDPQRTAYNTSPTFRPPSRPRKRT